MGNLACRPDPKSSLSPLSTRSPIATFFPTAFLPYCLTTGGGCDFRSTLEAAAATEEAAVFAADLVLPLMLATVWST